MALGTGIEIPNNFDLNSPLPLDARTVAADITARNAIPSVARHEGLIVYVIEEATNFQLIGGIANENWQEFSGGGGGIGSTLTWKSVPGEEPILVEDQFYRAYEFAQTYGQKLCATFSVPDSYKVGTKITVKVPVFVYSDIYDEDFTFKLMSFCNQFSVLGGGSPHESTAVQLPDPVTNMGEVYWLTLDVTDDDGEINSNPVLPGHIVKMVLERSSAVVTLEFIDRVMVLHEMIRMVI